MRLLLVFIFAACGTKDGGDTNGGTDTGETGDTGDSGTDTSDSGDSGVDTAVCNTDNEECAPGVSGCGGEGPDMLPGSDCISCHQRGGEEEAPTWTVGGTLYDDLYGTNGVRDAQVIITDADGNEEILDTSQTGNFFTSVRLIPPFSARVEFEGRTVEMVQTVETGACGSCHNCEGSAGGKLYAP